jgi:hypothetical protein
MTPTAWPTTLSKIPRKSGRPWTRWRLARTSRLDLARVARRDSRSAGSRSRTGRFPPICSRSPPPHRVDLPRRRATSWASPRGSSQGDRRHRTAYSVDRETAPGEDISRLLATDGFQLAPSAAGLRGKVRPGLPPAAPTEVTSIVSMRRSRSVMRRARYATAASGTRSLPASTGAHERELGAQRPRPRDGFPSLPSPTPLVRAAHLPPHQSCSGRSRW